MNYYQRKKAEAERKAALRTNAVIKYQKIVERILQAEKRNYSNVEIAAIIEPFDDPEENQESEVIFSCKIDYVKKHYHLFLKKLDGKRKYKLGEMPKESFEVHQGMYFLKNEQGG